MPLPKCVRVLEDDTQSREALEADGWRYVETLVEMKRATEVMPHKAWLYEGNRFPVKKLFTETLSPNRLVQDGKKLEAAQLRQKIVSEFIGQILTRDLDGYLLKLGNRLVMMAVKEDARELGVGTDLVKGFVSLAHAEGHDEVFLGTQEVNHVALALYGGLGFRTYRRRVTYHKD